MNIPFFISKRYFSLSLPKSITHWISYISTLGISIGTAALIIILSVFNGFEGLILDMYNSIDPHIKVSPRNGKIFNSESVNKVLLSNDEIKIFSSVIEEDIFLQNDEKHGFAKIKGVDNKFRNLNNFDQLLINPYQDSSKTSKYFSDFLESSFVNREKIFPANLGISLAIEQNIHLNNIPEKNYFTTIIPKKKSKSIIKESDLKKIYFKPAGFFSVNGEYDSKYIICSLDVVQNMLDLDRNDVSSIEIMIKDPKDINKVTKDLKRTLGKEYFVQSRIEQHEFLYKMLNSERLAVLIILTFILIVSSFNIISSLSMLIIEKKKDIKILSNLGSTNIQIQNIFFLKSLFNILLGSFLGITFGVIFSLLQEEYKFISMGDGNFLVNAYPVDIQILDIIIVQIIVLFIGIIVTYFPSRFLINRILKQS